MTDKEIKELFGSFNTLKVLIVGDVILDSYMWGKVNRISPEAPVPIVAVNKKEMRLGGAANVALNIRALGATPLLCSVIGKDSEGQAFLRSMKDVDLPSDGILESKSRITTVKTRIIGNNHQMLRIDEEHDHTISSKESEELFKRISALIATQKADVIIFEDYDKGILNPTLIEQVVKLANSKGIPTVVDPKKRNFHHYKNVSMFKPNLKELKDGLKFDFEHDTGKELSKVVDELRVKQKIGTALITLSEHGIYINNGKTKKIFPAHVRRVADVSGAGDTVVSVAALCCALGASPMLTASLANLAGGLVCERVGVVPVDKKQLMSEAIRLGLSK